MADFRGEVAIEVDKCKGCGLCVAFCPKGVLTLSEGINRSGYHPAEMRDDVEPSQCTACDICCRMCPDTAITVRRRPRR